MNPPPDTLSPALRQRLVRYAELRPCTNAFIDARTPGSDQKENFTIIGPGVAENPHQYVHIRDPHGFNIGGARQPPHCTNSLHSHDSEEVFVAHTGTWRFFWGEHGDAGEVVLNPGDTISIPIHVFRGFENIGKDSGFLFAILGGDDPGRVHWAPHVIEQARGHGLVLLDDGNLIDTTLGESIPPDRRAVEPSTREAIRHIRVPSNGEMRARVVARSSVAPNPHSALAASGTGVRESAIIGQASDDGFGVAPIDIPHGFTLRHLALRQAGETALHARGCVEVLFVHRGRIEFSDGAGHEAVLEAGDTLSVPPGLSKRLAALEEAEIYAVLGGDNPGPVKTA
ncbi:MAG: cupin domain-containing protein [Betaproteobacteria bacterium]|nr:cupin domain-containing protein [Betaproteobacteria bacterium]